jgi:hypothetical protein
VARLSTTMSDLGLDNLFRSADLSLPTALHV